MSIKDAYARFSDAQAVTVTADSEDVWDQGVGEDAWGVARAHPEIAEGRPLCLNVVARAAFTAGGSATFTVSIESCATVDGSYTVHYTGTTIAVAAMTAGSRHLAMALPEGLLRFVKLVYTVATGPMLTGTIDAWVGLEPVPTK